MATRQGLMRVWLTICTLLALVACVSCLALLALVACASFLALLAFFACVSFHPLVIGGRPTTNPGGCSISGAPE